MVEDDEKRFLVTVIKVNHFSLFSFFFLNEIIILRNYLVYVNKNVVKIIKHIIASNIMYVVGQYPRFLRAHWKFLKTVVNKLFEFMHGIYSCLLFFILTSLFSIKETHEGVQDMACDTFIKIAQKCRRHFITIQLGESQPFVDEI